MWSLLSASAVLLGVDLVRACLRLGMGCPAGAVYDGPYPHGPYDTGSYRDTFARAAHPGASRCLMHRRARPTPQGLSYYAVRVCR
jgi:hypothetical protein